MPQRIIQIRLQLINRAVNLAPESDLIKLLQDRLVGDSPICSGAQFSQVICRLFIIKGHESQ